jgi:hypothetical protein
MVHALQLDLKEIFIFVAISFSYTIKQDLKVMYLLSFIMVK